MPDEVQDRRQEALTFEGRLTQEDVRRGFALHLQASRMGGRGAALAAQVGGAAIGIAGLVWVATGTAPAPQSLGWLFALLLLVAVLVAAAPRWAAAMLARNALRAGGGVADTRKGTAGEEGLHTVSAHSDTRQDWQAFLMYRRGSDVLVLYPTRRIVQMYTRGLFASDADWRAFGDLVAAHVPEASQAIRSSPAALRALRVVVVLLLAMAVVALVLVLTRMHA